MQITLPTRHSKAMVLPRARTRGGPQEEARSPALASGGSPKREAGNAARGAAGVSAACQTARSPGGALRCYLQKTLA